MSSFLQRIFRPKWQHEDARIRAQAVVDMDKTKSDNQKVIHNLCMNDPSREVRLAAFQKIEQLPVLIEFIQSTAPEKHPELVDRINQLANTETLSLLPQETRINLIPWLKDDQLGINLIQKITDASLLKVLATNGKSAKVRLMALEQITDIETLKDLQTKVRGKDKRAYQILKEKLSTVKEAEKRDEEQKQQAALLLDQLQQIAVCEVNRLTEPRFKTLQSRWASLEPLVGDNLQKQIADTIRVCEQRIAEFIQTRKLEKEEAEVLQEQNKEREQTLSTLSATLDELRADSPTETARLVALDAILKTQETRWLEATRDVTPSKHDQKNYQELMREIRGYLAAANRLNSMQEEALRILQPEGDTISTERGDSRKLQSLLKDVNWPEGFTEPPVIKKIQNYLGIVSEMRLKKEADIRQACDLITQKTGELEILIEARSLKASQKLLREIQKRIAQLPENTGSPYASRLALLHRQLKDLEDWAGFATQPKQVELCERMETLAEQPLDPQFKAEKIQEMQKQWKAFGGASDHALWQRFKFASDKAFEPCQAFFKEQGELKKRNLEKRTSICESLSQLLQGVQWEAADWKGLDKISRTAKKEWKDAFPVDFKESKALQKKFNDLIDTLDKKLAAEREANQKTKEDLVAASEALITHEPLTEAIHQAKELQRKWGDVGITEFTEDRRLWKTFRTYCDQIFARRDAQRAEDSEKREANLGIAQSIAEKAELLAELMPGDDPLNELNSLESQSASLALTAEETKRLKSTLLKCREEIQHKMGEAEEKAYRSLWESFLNSALSDEPSKKIAEVTLPGAELLKMALESAESTEFLSLYSYIDSTRDACILIEILKGATTEEADQGRRTALQVARLNAGMKGEKPANNPDEQICELLAGWLKLSRNDDTRSAPRQDEILRLKRALSPKR